MESAVVLSNDDVKEIIAKHFNVELSKVVKSQYIKVWLLRLKKL